MRRLMLVTVLLVAASSCRGASTVNQSTNTVTAACPSFGTRLDYVVLYWPDDKRRLRADYPKCLRYT
jgi:hypothetical protein